uniref:Uncharacterized protein n=1 Tax=Setaria italica TaxID=4555 RepID=K3Z184_SETIT
MSTAIITRGREYTLYKNAQPQMLILVGTQV